MKLIDSATKTNWKFFLIMLGVTIGVGLLGFLAFGRLSTVSTNKDVYARGEDVVVSFSDFRLSRCNTGGPKLSFFSKTADGWKGFKYKRGIIYSFGQSVCVDGMLSSGAYPADIQTCRFFDRPRLSGTYIWNGRVYEEEDDQKVCGNLKSVHFYSRLAPPGKYKIKWGNAEQVFEIKEDERGQQEERVEEWKFKEDDISNWQTYRNDEFGFEVKYPSTHMTEIETVQETPEISCFSFNLFSKEQPKESSIFGIYIDCGGRGLGNQEAKEYVVNGKKAKSYSFEYPALGYEYILIVLFEDNNTYNFTGNKIRTPEQRMLFDQILSTFRFVGE